MEIRVFVLPAGKLQIFGDGDGVTFEQARAATEQILAGLKAQGLPAEMIGDVEMHKDGVSHVHMQQGVKHEQRH
jgi:hypothetical protein